MKTMVVYKSKYGSTKKYAEWLSGSLNADVFEIGKISVEKMQGYDTIVYAGGLYAGGIAGISKLKNNYNKLSDKNVVVIAVGSSPFSEEIPVVLRKKNFTAEMENVKCFYLRGAYNYPRMNMLHKMMMNMMGRILKKKGDNLTPDEKGLLSMIHGTDDWTSEENLKPIINYINSKCV